MSHFTVHRCPDCGRAFKMREHGKCPHCGALLFVGKEIRQVSLSKTRGWYWDGQSWVNLRQLVAPSIPVV